MSTSVDDIKIIRVKDSKYIQKVKEELTVPFLIVEIGSISFYLDLKVEQD